MIRIEQRGARTGLEIVMIHGAPSAPASMWHIGDELTDVGRVSNVHLPGYDGSTPLVPYEEERMLADVEDALARALVERPVLIGFSFGAFRCLELATRGALRARAIASLGGLHDMTREHREGLRGSGAVVRDSSQDLAALFTGHFLSPHGMKTPALVAEVATWFTAASRQDMANELEAVSTLPGLDVGGVDVPVLVRVGTLDVATPPALSEALASALPRATLQLVPGAAHALMLEDKEGTIAALRAFIASL